MWNRAATGGSRRSRKASTLPPIPSPTAFGGAGRAEKDIQIIFGARWEGHGPVESTIIRYAFLSPGGVGRWDSRWLSEITRPTQIWLMGDTGIPKNATRVPSGGYLTEIVTFPPDPRMSGMGLSADALPGTGRGLDGFLIKPINQEKLLTIIKGCLSRVEQSAGATEPMRVIHNDVRAVAREEGL